MNAAEVVVGNTLLVGIVVAGGVTIFVVMTIAWVRGEVADMFSGNGKRARRP